MSIRRHKLKVKLLNTTIRIIFFQHFRRVHRNTKYKNNVVIGVIKSKIFIHKYYLYYLFFYPREKVMYYTHGYRRPTQSASFSHCVSVRSPDNVHRYMVREWYYDVTEKIKKKKHLSEIGKVHSFRLKGV